MAQIARSVARALKVNEDLTEAIALGHDLGHPPFGHRGQDILNELMEKDGGFEHNAQTLRIVCIIEHRYPGFPGLNLTYEVREGFAKSRSQVDNPLAAEFKASRYNTLEAQIADLADPIAYTTHDLDDGITAGTITAEMLKESELWQEGLDNIKKHEPEMSPKLIKYHVIRYIINQQVTDLLDNTAKNLYELAPKSPDEVRNADIKLADFSIEAGKKHIDLKKFLRRNMYDHYHVKRMEHKARQIITDLFNAFLGQPELLPPNVRVHYDAAKKKGEEKRIVCDYVAGMTDKFAVDEHEKIHVTK